MDKSEEIGYKFLKFKTFLSQGLEFRSKGTVKHRLTGSDWYKYIMLYLFATGIGCSGIFKPNTTTPLGKTETLNTFYLICVLNLNIAAVTKPPSVSDFLKSLSF